MNPGELPLKTRRRVSLAADGAGTGSTATAAREAAAINRKTRRREVFMVLCERKAVKVMRDRRAVNASIRCAATRHALCRLVEFVLASRWNLLRRAAPAVSLMSPDPGTQTAAGPVPSANGTKPPRGRPRRPTAPVF